VYRGTWKHTDIAAKEYLPQLTPSGQQGSPDSPFSEAAGANAQVGCSLARTAAASFDHGIQF